MIDNIGNGITIKEYIEKIINERERLYSLQFETLKEQVERLNKLRDEAKTDFITKTEFNLKHEVIETKISIIKKLGKLGYVGLGLLIALVVILRIWG